ncbi:monovalent cation/H(+) antiporter subunit G [Arthrobacter sp. ATA002]|uniref:monovalent cation/H(+) antiporter subunit G n=1 Tax=Arthrobacter sp. ATA002 TaxID=2991715 RepID=UPI003FA46801
MNQELKDLIVGILMLGGALMSLAAAIGLTRFPDLMSRMHAASKPQVLGLLLFLLAMAVQFESWALLPILAVCWLFMLLTAPVSAHMVGRAGYRTKHLRPELLTIDELDDVVTRSQELLQQARAGTADVVGGGDPRAGRAPAHPRRQGASTTTRSPLRRPRPPRHAPVRSRERKRKRRGAPSHRDTGPAAERPELRGE